MSGANNIRHLDFNIEEDFILADNYKDNYNIKVRLKKILYWDTVVLQDILEYNCVPIIYEYKVKVSG